MDKHCAETFQELNNMQSKIASLFQDLLVERHHYKSSSDKLKKSLEEVSVEVRNLKKQNEKLQQGNQQLRSVIYECLKVFRYLDLSESTLIKDHKIIVDLLKQILSVTNCTSSEPVEIDVMVKKETYSEENENSSTRYSLNQDDIKKEIDAIKDLQFTTQFFDSVEIKQEEELILSENQSDMVLEKPLFVKETEPFDARNETGLLGLEIQETVYPLSEVTTPKKHFFNSPVFKDFGNRRQNSLSTEENCIDDSRRKIVNEKLLLKSADLIISPLKIPNMPDSSSPKRDKSSPKRTRKKLKIDSPAKSPVNQLKKSNSREAEISVSGARKLTQTLLNIECFKIKTPEKKKNGENIENEGNAEPTNANKTKALVDVDEDDVIMESPKKSEQVLEDVKNKKKTGSSLNESPFKTPSKSPEADLDETYVSSSVIKKCKMTSKHILEKIYEDQIPVKQPNRERTPYCDSVPFVYKREAVRSKAERKKLPGHACLECNKYYKNALGEDLSPGKLKEILNKCSRHRDKNSPSQDDTPPGYWKPYLTASVMTLQNNDDTIIQ